MKKQILLSLTCSISIFSALLFSPIAQEAFGQSSLKALLLYWHSGREDNFITTKERAAEPNRGGTAADMGYEYAQNEACVLSSSQPDTSALKLYWSEERQDNFSTATTVGQKSAVDAGYRYVGIDGYVFTTQKPGTVPLNLYWNAGRGDNMTTASAAGIQAAKDAGYNFVRTEGYVYPANQCQ
ncbi:MULTISPECIES: hypothetical protein [Calothrix]|uniref:DUF5648 domain-containing protein n=2 Tax=Calothrix TaxID=1186 RepID=A0ABR8AL61_9CYAN|nr:MULTISPECIES: hypothetical protein [Calothrix]MBD2199975.1 hypothetical protein [Calothrix parietina FACHB-288]MBD2228858.1 hypothetical protein [Calothrix anomala FACHB-343]